jgi:DNA polymerase delta subunit 4
VKDKHKLIGWENCTDKDIILKKFDLDMAFGPCIQISRLERWERAHNLGLNPPQVIKDLIGEKDQESLWDRPLND